MLLKSKTVLRILNFLFFHIIEYSTFTVISKYEIHVSESGDLARYFNVSFISLKLLHLSIIIFSEMGQVLLFYLKTILQFTTL